LASAGKPRGITKAEIRLFYALTFAVFVGLTAIDYIVHRTLYSYGLVFDFSWADPYWTALTLSFFSTALFAAGTYWISDTPRKSTAILIFSTVFGLYLAGGLDVLWWIFYKIINPQAPIPWNVVWWWSPFNRFLGLPWTLKHQIALLLGFVVIVDIAWLLTRRKR